jgi:hypothetical protein
MRTLLAATAAILVAGSTMASAATDAECAAAWTAVDADKNGIVTEAEAARYHAAIRNAGKTIAEDKLTQPIFLEHCKAGLFTARQNDPGAPLKGANSFTEGQAKDRAVAHGFTDVSALAKDADGIWRGTAKSNDKQVTVAVDFKGNVVGQ